MMQFSKIETWNNFHEKLMEINQRSFVTCFTEKRQNVEILAHFGPDILIGSFQ